MYFTVHCNRNGNSKIGLYVWPEVRSDYRFSQMSNLYFRWIHWFNNNNKKLLSITLLVHVFPWFKFYCSSVFFILFCFPEILSRKIVLILFVCVLRLIIINLDLHKIKDFHTKNHSLLVNLYAFFLLHFIINVKETFHYNFQSRKIGLLEFR